MVKQLALLTATLILATQSVYADTDIQWYEVELIFFRQLSSTAIDNETWQPQLLQPDTGECVDIQLQDPEDQYLQPFTAIPKQELRLNNEAAAIARSKGQRVLAHIGWRQPGYDQNNAIPVRINAGPLLLARPLVQEELNLDGSEALNTGESAKPSLYPEASNTTPTEEEQSHTPAKQQATSAQQATVTPLSNDQQVVEIEIREAEEQAQAQAVATSKLHGCVKIFRERYLHIITDLIYYHEDNEDIYAENDETYAFGKQVNVTAIPVKSRRRMRSKELHYLDNPGAGVVVLVTPYDFSEEESEAAE